MIFTQDEHMMERLFATVMPFIRDEKEDCLVEFEIDGKLISIDTTSISKAIRFIRQWSEESLKHIRIVQEYVYRTGIACNLDRSFVICVTKLSSVHDMGKVGIDFDILEKKGGLTPDERSIVRQHPLTGLKIFSFFADALSEEERKIAESIILYHHERWDGLGYPNGLKGEEIPAEARLVAIADAVAVMLAGTPYKEPISPDELPEILKAEKGCHFDPEMTEALLCAL